MLYVLMRWLLPGIWEIALVFVVYSVFWYLFSSSQCFGRVEREGACSYVVIGVCGRLNRIIHLKAKLWKASGIGVSSIHQASHEEKKGIEMWSTSSGDRRRDEMFLFWFPLGLLLSTPRRLSAMSRGESSPANYSRCTAIGSHPCARDAAEKRHRPYGLTMKKEGEQCDALQRLAYVIALLEAGWSCRLCRGGAFRWWIGTDGVVVQEM